MALTQYKVDRGLYIFRFKSQLGTFIYHKLKNNKYKYCFFYKKKLIPGITNLYNVINYIILFKMSNLLKKKLDIIEDEVKSEYKHISGFQLVNKPLYEAVNILGYRSGNACWKRKHKK